MSDLDLTRVTGVARLVEERTNRLLAEFRNFMLKQNMVSLVIAFILGGATNSLVQQTSKSIIMPLINYVIRDQSWRDLQFLLNYYKDAEGKPVGNYLVLGDFLWAGLNFAIVGIIAFFLSKYILRMPLHPSHVTTRVCPSCLESVQREAKVCKFCTRDLPALPPPEPTESP